MEETHDTQLFRDVFNASPIGIVIETLEGRPLFVNPAFCSMLGFSEEEMRQKHCVQFSPPEDAAKDWALFQQLRAGSIDHYQLEKRYFRRDGSLVWGRLSISLLKVVPSPLVIAMVEDITDKRTAEEALRESEERFRLAARAGKMYAYEWDVTTDVVVRSGDAATVLGSASEAALTRQQILAKVHPDDRALFAASETERTPGNPEVQITYRTLSDDGSVLWLEKTARAFFDEGGRMVRMIGMVSAITERKRSEERLREYEKAVEGAEDMIAVIDREYRFLLANRQYLNMRNLTREQVVGHFIPEILTRKEFETVIKPKLDECFQGKVVKYEERFSYPKVGDRDLSLSYFPIEGVDGVDRAACILRDITERKRAEQAIAGMTRKLMEAQEQERARIGRELHDDINQRLALLAIELGHLQEHPSDVARRVPELRQKIDEISRDVQSLSHDLHSSKLEYLGVVSGMRSWCKDFGEQQNMEIRFKSDVSIAIPFEIGRTLLRVLQEALHNTVKHSGVRQVEVQLLQKAGQFNLIVSDSGRGFNVEEGMQNGGLGLTSMRERVRLVNGKISIDSKPMSGTTIRVYVPLDLEQASHRAAG